MTAAVLLLAGALVAWPGPLAADRLRALDAWPGGVRAGQRNGRPGGPLYAARQLVGRIPAPLLLPLLAGGVGLVVAGPLHAGAAAVLAGAAADLRGRSRARRERLERLGAWERALDDASSALRAGAGPEHALARAADAAGGVDAGVAGLLTSAAAHARLGGDVAAALCAGDSTDGRRFPASVHGVIATRGEASVHGATAIRGEASGHGEASVRVGGPVSGDRVATELAGAWLLATRHGVALADVVDGLRADVASRRERALRVDATLAGPRATAVILTALPALGVLLGSGFGADPLGVLLDGVLGGVLCLAGAVFLAAGLLWTDRIAGGAAR